MVMNTEYDIGVRDGIRSERQVDLTDIEGLDHTRDPDPYGHHGIAVKDRIREMIPVECENL